MLQSGKGLMDGFLSLDGRFPRLAKSARHGAPRRAPPAPMTDLACFSDSGNHDEDKPGTEGSALVGGAVEVAMSIAE